MKDLPVLLHNKDYKKYKGKLVKHLPTGNIYRIVNLNSHSYQIRKYDKNYTIIGSEIQNYLRYNLLEFTVPFDINQVNNRVRYITWRYNLPEGRVFHLELQTIEGKLVERDYKKHKEFVLVEETQTMSVLYA